MNRLKEILKYFLCVSVLLIGNLAIATDVVELGDEYAMQPEHEELPVDYANQGFFKQEQYALAWADNKMIIIRTADEHPENSNTFNTTNGVAPFSLHLRGGFILDNDGRVINKVNKMLMAWPPHCIKGTKGALLVNPVKPSHKIWAKGQKQEAYGALEDEFGNLLGRYEDSKGDNTKRVFVSREEELKRDNVGGAFVSGLAGDHCVDTNGIQLAKRGIEVSYIVNHTRWLQAHAESDADYEKSIVDNIKKLDSLGVKFCAIEEGAAPWEQEAFVKNVFNKAGVKITNFTKLDDAHADLKLRVDNKYGKDAAKNIAWVFTDNQYGFSKLMKPKAPQTNS